MAKFIMACNCPICGERCTSDGITIDFTAPEGVVVLDNFACQDWHCDECDIDFGTGEIEQWVEEF